MTAWTRFAVAGIVLLVVGCGSERPFVEVPNNNNKSLNLALQRLHDAGLRASFPSTKASAWWQSGGFMTMTRLAPIPSPSPEESAQGPPNPVGLYLAWMRSSISGR